MHYEITTTRVDARPIASIDVHATPDELDALIPGLLDEVWEHLKGIGLDRQSHNVVIYYDAEVHLEAGIEVPGDSGFEGEGRIERSSTPAGLAARTVHIGPYEQLSEAHEALRSWCADKGYHTVGPVWEVYGEWTDDTSKLRTEVFYLIDSDPA